MGMGIHACGRSKRAWAYGVGFIRDTMHMSKANGVRAQKMLIILGSIVNMIGGGDLHHHLMSKKSSL